MVLSACETGVGKIEEAEGVAGLGKAFINAGAKQVITSLWSVSDTSTALLMGKFYENIKAGDSYSKALRSAKKWMIKHNKSHPYYWAGFVGSGVN
ncbi:FOG: TPR repeat [hydrothermal vent metagenome]|uniref:FOG: TPR repeat n=1 Tax=hydrothermal vent metagenome TaxID=652676 RepID=A0A1W1BRC1_9ZZZZ